MHKSSHSGHICVYYTIHNNTQWFPAAGTKEQASLERNGETVALSAER